MKGKDVVGTMTYAFVLSTCVVYIFTGMVEKPDTATLWMARIPVTVVALAFLLWFVTYPKENHE